LNSLTYLVGNIPAVRPMSVNLQNPATISFLTIYGCYYLGWMKDNLVPLPRLKRLYDSHNNITPRSIPACAWR